MSHNIDEMLTNARDEARATALSDALEMIRGALAQEWESERRANADHRTPEDDAAYAQGRVHGTQNAYRRVQGLL